MTFEDMKKIVVDTLNCDEDKVTMEASLTEDLEADSLDAVELNMALEDACGVSIPDEELANLKTVGDIYNYITAPRLRLTEAKRDERYQRPAPGQDAGAHLPAESPAGCRVPCGTTRSSWNASSAAAAPPARSGTKSLFVCPNCGFTCPSARTTA